MVSGLSQRIVNTLTEKKLCLFAALWSLVLLLNLPAYQAGFNGDFEGLLDMFYRYTFSEFINSKGFEVKSLYQVTHFQLYCFISLFGLHPLPWYLLLTGLHALNATLIFRFCKRLFSDFEITNGPVIAFFGALIFTINPIITEITIWKGGYHYLPGLMMQVLLLLWTQTYLKTGNKKLLWFSAILFFISTFTLEIFYLSPWFCLLLMLAYRWKELITKARFGDALKLVFLPQISIFVLNLLIYRMRYGAWVAHYGSNGGFKFSLDSMLDKMLRYLSTILGFTAFGPHENSNAIYAFLNKPAVYYTAFTIVIGLSILIFVRFKKFSANAQAAAFLFGMMMFCVAIISPMYFDETMQLYNSRRCYELSFPVMMLMSLGIFSIFKHSIFSKIIFGVYIVLYTSFTVQKAFEWRNADYMQRSMVRNYKWQHAKNVLILNMPCYYHDIRIIPTGRWDEFQENLKLFGYDTSKNKIHYVSAYNMNSLYDGAHVTIVDSTTLKVTLNQWGSWWMYDLNGALDFENELYILEMKDVGHEYILHLKKPMQEFTILFQRENAWKQLNTSAKPGSVQW
ncbi:MAG: hypothetical protein WC716_05060 [Chitinophagaceae bacterium]|jgi:hypothetical protein